MTAHDTCLWANLENSFGFFLRQGISSVIFRCWCLYKYLYFSNYKLLLFRMTPKDIIDKTPGLIREQLSYYVKMGYVAPRKHTRGKNEYSEFAQKDLLVIQKAFYYIERFGTKPKTAFEKAREELRQPELRFE